MNLRDLTPDELRAVVEQWFADSPGNRTYNNVRDISTDQVYAAIQNNYRLVQNVNTQFQQTFGEMLGQGLAQNIGAAELAKNIITAAADGTLDIKALEVTDKNGNTRTISLQTRAKTIARTENNRLFEDTKRQTAEELLDDPIGIARTVGDRDVRSKHQLWEGYAMPLSAWETASDRPGKKPNCRCTLRIVPRDAYKGTIHTSLPF